MCAKVAFTEEAWATREYLEKKYLPEILSPFDTKMAIDDFLLFMESGCPEEAHLYSAPSKDWRTGLLWTAKSYRRMATNRCGTHRSSD